MPPSFLGWVKLDANVLYIYIYNYIYIYIFFICIILRDFPYKSTLFGLGSYYNDTCFTRF